jgi:hypothetical protein
MVATTQITVEGTNSCSSYYNIVLTIIIQMRSELMQSTTYPILIRPTRTMTINGNREEATKEHQARKNGNTNGVPKEIGIKKIIKDTKEVIKTTRQWATPIKLHITQIIRKNHFKDPKETIRITGLTITITTTEIIMRRKMTMIQNSLRSKFPPNLRATDKLRSINKIRAKARKILIKKLNLILSNHIISLTIPRARNRILYQILKTKIIYFQMMIFSFSYKSRIKVFRLREET